ncbi:MAG: hypothetical protein J0652_02640 [Desulfobulbaceae bacterium]|nr:hypothetical protein [Desulfobulbaceae bacterium]
MSIPIPTIEPVEVTAGDSLTWSISLADYPASDGWVLSYVLLSSSAKIAFSSAASGSSHLVTVTAAESALWAADTYDWQSYVTNAAERHTVASGRTIVRANFASSTPKKSTARLILAAINAALLGTGTLTQRMLEINGKRIERHSPAELLAMRTRLMHEVAAEEAAARIAAGLDSGNTLLVRFR